MSYVAHKEEIGEFTLEIVSDEDPMSPRDWDNIGTMVCFHKRYTLGDKHNYKEPQDFLIDLLKEYGTEKELKKIVLDTCKDNIRLYRNLVKYKIKGTRRDQLVDMVQYLVEYESVKVEDFPEAVTVLPLYLYDHSGITMSVSGFSCPWDSGQVGWIYVSNDKLKEEKIDNKTPEEISQYLVGEVETYAQFLEGDVYGFVVSKTTTCECCSTEDKDTLESCWGFFGSESALEEGKAVLNSLVEQAQKEATV